MDGAPLSRFENPKNPKKKRERLLLFLLSSFSLFLFLRGVFLVLSCWTVEVMVDNVSYPCHGIPFHLP